MDWLDMLVALSLFTLAAAVGYAVWQAASNRQARREGHISPGGRRMQAKRAHEKDPGHTRPPQ